MSFRLYGWALLLPLAAQAQGDPVALLQSTPFYQEACHSSGEPLALAPCNYTMLDLAGRTREERRTLTRQITGLGFDSPYVLVLYPREAARRQIYLLDTLDEPYLLELLYDRLDRPAPRARRMARSAGTEATPLHEVAIIKHLPLGRDGKGSADLKYKVRMYSTSPYYSQGSDSDKYVEVLLEEGAGITFLPEKEHYYLHRTFSSRKDNSKNFVYRQYLDSVRSRVSITAPARMNRLVPTQQMQDNTSYQKEENTTVKVGFSSFPKIPIKDISVGVSSKTTIEAKTSYTLNAANDERSAWVEYANNLYGSRGSNKYCDLNTASGWCWDYYDQGVAPYDFNKIRDTIPTAMAGMKPEFKVQMRAPREASGHSTLTVETDIRGIELLAHNRWIIGRRWGAGNKLWQDDQSRGANGEWRTGQDYLIQHYPVRFEMDVDWSSPLFLGADSVYIQSTYLSEQQAHCLTVRSGQLGFEPCRIGDRSQAFVFDQMNRYRSVADLDRCLSSEQGLALSSRCDQPLPPNGQNWRWQQPELFGNDVLFTGRSDGRINLLDAAGPGILTQEANAPIPNTARFTTQKQIW